MTDPLDPAMADAIARSLPRLIDDYALAYHRSTFPHRAVEPAAFATALRAVAAAPHRNASGAICAAAPAILALVARWPATLGDSAAAWELLLIGGKDPATRPAALAG